MEIEIRRLTPGLAEEYARFFDTTSHNDEGNGEKCYCVTWRRDDSYVGDDHWYPTPEERRARAIGFIKDGSLQGYLAYLGDRIIGWCSATAECSLGVNYLRSFWSIEEYREDINVMSVFCFMIAPRMQRKGVATQLLERVIKDASDDGFDYVEAYIDKVVSDAGCDFRGPLKLYEKCGFSIYAEKDGKAVVRKALKNVMPLR